MKINKIFTSFSFLILILVLAAVLRFWNLDSNPPSLTPDEAALGYNAYSILTTGRDEYGQFMPLIFKSFGDFKPGFYIYLALPFVWLLGLNELSVRLPSAISGLIIIILIYLITKILTENKKPLALASAFIAATNPWLIHFSRGAWEANVSLALTLSGIYFFLKSLKEVKFLFPSAALFSLTLITYQGAKLSTLVVLVILSLVFFRDSVKLLKNHAKILAICAIIGIFIASPAFLSFFRGQTGRLAVFSVFNYPRPEEYTKSFLDKAGEEKDSLIYYKYHSESLNFARGIMGRFFNHFGTRFLFFEGDYQNPNLSAPNQGVLLMIGVIFLPLGVIILLRRRTKLSSFILLWLILAPLPAILSRDQVQSIRALNMSVPLTIICGVGFWWSVEKLNGVRSSMLRIGGYSTLIILFISSFIYFLDAYFVHLPVHNARYWHYGFKQAVLTIIPIQDRYDQVIFQQGYSQPYMYFLFYGAKLNPAKYAPGVYQKNADIEITSSDVGLVKSLDNIEFQFFSWTPDIQNKKTLVAGNNIAIPGSYSKDEFSLIKEIKYPDNLNTAIRILETK